MIVCIDGAFALNKLPIDPWCALHTGECVCVCVCLVCFYPVNRVVRIDSAFALTTLPLDPWRALHKGACVCLWVCPVFFNRALLQRCAYVNFSIFVYPVNTIVCVDGAFAFNKLPLDPWRALHKSVCVCWWVCPVFFTARSHTIVCLWVFPILLYPVNVIVCVNAAFALNKLPLDAWRALHTSVCVCLSVWPIFVFFGVLSTQVRVCSVSISCFFCIQSIWVCV